MPPVLELKGITKRFPGVLANDHINLSLNEGEILALLGENGAGKSTLMNILYGLYQPDEGEIFVRGKRTIIQSPTDAIRMGIGMVHQHFHAHPGFHRHRKCHAGGRGDAPGRFPRPRQGSRAYPRHFPALQAGS